MKGIFMPSLSKTTAKILGFSLLALAGGAFAQESGPTLKPMKVFASYEGGQVEDFDKDISGPVPGENKRLMSQSAVWFLQEARLSENARVYLGVGGMYFFILPSEQNPFSSGQRSAFGLTDAHAEFDFGMRENGDHLLRLKTGIFPYKYNEDAKNLGEYMFRTYAYPNIISTGGLMLVNSAAAQLSGVSAGTKFMGLTNELLLTVKTDQVPTTALSLTDIVSYNIGGFLTVGAGYMFDNFYSADGIAKGNAIPRATFQQSYYYEMADGTYELYDPNAPPTGTVVDSGNFSFVSQKAMWRASADLGNVISLVAPGVIASNTFKLYYEGILMGVENRPIFYEKRKDRIAHMVGVNIPTFGVLDVLSGELEYCSNPYAPDMANAVGYLSATPATNRGSDFHSDDLKWSLYARKTLIPGFSVTAQAARDHTRMTDFRGKMSDLEVLYQRDHWYWALQMSYSI
jgi:hypothetical protein